MGNRNLLDTHTFLWFLAGNSELSKTARHKIEEENSMNFISIASIWEIAIKVSLGKLELNKPFHHILDELGKNGFEILPITFEDTLFVSNLPFQHRDPFDRIIIAQAFTNKLTLISKDSQFANYPIKLIW